MLHKSLDKLLTNESQRVEISLELSTAPSDNNSIEQTLNNHMMIAENYRRQLSETAHNLDNLATTSKL